MKERGELIHPAISVIMPVYNAERHLNDAVCSILTQTFQDFELLIIDDGSTEQSLPILYSFKDPRIQILTNETNRGTYPTRNRGLQLAKGKYIAVMDADDIALPDRLLTQYNYMEKHTDVCVIGAGTMFWPYSDMQPNADSIRAVLLLNNCFIHSSLFIRKELMTSLGGYDERFTYAADYDLVCRIALKGKLEILQQPFVQYRWHDQQISICKKEEQQYFAEQIRNAYRKAFIRQYLLPDMYEPAPFMLSHSRMNLVIALFIYARFLNSCFYSKLAETYLDNVISELSSQSPLGLKDGLIGFVCGCQYLLDNGFVTGEANDIFAEIDIFLSSQDLQTKEKQIRQEYDLYRQIRKAKHINICNSADVTF